MRQRNAIGGVQLRLMLFPKQIVCIGPSTDTSPCPVCGRFVPCWWQAGVTHYVLSPVTPTQSLTCTGPTGGSRPLVGQPDPGWIHLKR
jgi:hypothetical protein